jgi:hypothetical protein
MLMEDIATSPLPPSGEADRLLVLAELDGLPIESRTELGKTLIRFMTAAARYVGEGTMVHSRTVLPNPDEFGSHDRLTGGVMLTRRPRQHDSGTQR